MHMEPGVVDGAKMALGFATGAGAAGMSAKYALACCRKEGISAYALRSGVATAIVVTFFGIFPHVTAGISEVHLILGSTLFLLFGVAPAAAGLAAGLLLQGMLLSPADLPQYGMNLTTLLVPLFAINALSKRIIPVGTAYSDVTYAQALRLSTTYQGGIVAWVAFWAFYGQGFGAANLAAVATFGASYMAVVLVEPFADLAVLAAVTQLSGRGRTQHMLILNRLRHAD